ncbi:hypothetical protein BHE74_00049190 [Ensete ventricosum]|nr:hypothetical protein BHE74_00049190 [Ensete ventricosum]
MSPLPLRRRRALPLCDLAVGGRYPCGLVVLKQPLAGAALQAAVPVVAYRPCELATTGRPLCRRPGRASSFSLCLLRKCRRSYIPVFQIRMEKMKEVKRPPL